LRPDAGDQLILGDEFSRPIEQCNEGVEGTAAQGGRFVEIARNLCLLRLGDEEIARNFRVSLAQMKRWKRDHPEFEDAFTAGRDADAQVASALFQRAVGYSHLSEKIHFTKDGEIIRAPITVHYPPDATALAFYLTNRQRERWKREHATGDINLNISLEQLVLDSIKYREERDAKARPKPSSISRRRMPSVEPLSESGENARLPKPG
jgi:hypothetical protein